MILRSEAEEPIPPFDDSNEDGEEQEKLRCRWLTAQGSVRVTKFSFRAKVNQPVGVYCLYLVATASSTLNEP
jgi:hypothetical protein